jgi:hypothetical protein
LQALQFEREEGSFAGRYLGGFALMGLVARRRRAAPSLVMRMRAAFPDEEGSASGARRCSVAATLCFDIRDSINTEEQI